MTYKPTLQPQYITKYKCCDGWNQIGSSMGCVYREYLGWVPAPPPPHLSENE